MNPDFGGILMLLIGASDNHYAKGLIVTISAIMLTLGVIKPLVTLYRQKKQQDATAIQAEMNLLMIKQQQQQMEQILLLNDNLQRENRRLSLELSDIRKGHKHEQPPDIP